MGTIRDVQIRNWINAGKAVAKSDGDGLTFTLSSGGTASWVLRYRLSGKQRELTLGRYPDVTTAAARKLATGKRVEVQQGVDVARKNQKTKLESARAWTFGRRQAAWPACCLMEECYRKSICRFSRIQSAAIA